MLIPARSRSKLNILVLFGILHLSYFLFFHPLGHFSGDEAIYHLMARSFAESGSLDVWNGYEEFPAPELVLPNLRTKGNHLIPQYPPFYAILAAPFYKIGGLRGLIFLNSISFLGVVGLCYAIALKLFQNKNIALKACLILIAATFAWEYSNAIWPHALSMLFIIGSFYLALVSHGEADQQRSTRYAFLAGLAVGLGAGIRFDTIFIMPALIVPFLFQKPLRPRQILSTVLGTSPPLIFLAVLNQRKFGIASPFTYGNTTGATSGVTPYIPLLIFVLAGALIPFIFSRLGPTVQRKRFSFAIFLLVLLVGLFYLPDVISSLDRLTSGIYRLVLDLRALEAEKTGHFLTPDGGILYFNHMKKSLLQSCPYLVLLIFPFLWISKDKVFRFNLIILYIIPVLFIGVFSFFSWHGGLCFNMRYFLPILPFTSIISAYAFERIYKDLNKAWINLSALSGAVVYFLFLFFIAFENYFFASSDFIYLRLPLFVVFSIFILGVMTLFFRGRRFQTYIRGIIFVFFSVGLVWSGIVAFAYDFAHEYVIRHSFAEVSGVAAEQIEADSILFADFIDPFFGLIEKDRLRLARIPHGNLNGILDLMNIHLSNRPVYISLSSENWDKPETKDFLKSFSIMPMFKHKFGQFAQITKANNNLYHTN